MLSFLKKIFGSTPAKSAPAESAPAPYKVETPQVGEFPFPSAKPVQAKKKTADKKPAVQAKTARKPKAPK